MKRFFLGVLAAVLTLGVVVGACLLLSRKEKQDLPVPTETLPQVTKQTVPAATEPETQPTIPAETQLPEKQTVDAVPRYFQTDYPYIKFGNGTISTSGCSITCLAMVATYMTDQEYTPPQMAYHFGKFGKTNIERLDHGIAQMQLPYERTENVQDVLDAVRNGKVAIVMMDEESIFTTEQHFIVVAGMNGPDRFVVNDPIEDHYASPEPYIKNGYDNGFEDFYLLRGFSGGWIFDKSQMPEEPFLYDATMPEQQANRYEGYTLTGEDIYMLACFVYAEAREESPEVQQAVAEVVLNRVMSPDYPNTVKDAIYQTEFYRSAQIMRNTGEPELEQYIAVDTAMYGPYILPEDICFYSAWEKGTDVWGKLGSFTFARSR